MATLKCLACGHDNSVGDESCSSCSSSLNLKLCSACEAINANNAERCHSCNAEFFVEPEVAEPIAVEVDLRPVTGQEPPVYEFLPATWHIAAQPVRRRRGKLAAALAVLPLLAAGLAYYFYAVSPAFRDHPPAAKVEAAQKSEPKAEPETAPSEPARPQVAEPKHAPAPAVSAKNAPPRATAAPRSASLSEPKRASAAVTHTRAASTEAPARTPAAEAPARTTAAVAPVAVTPAPAASAAILPVSEAPAAGAEKRISVTHTKAVLTETAGTTTAGTTAAPAAVTQVRTVPDEARNEEPAGCPPAVVALGLCKSR